LFTSSPPEAATAWRRAAKCRRRSSSAASSPRRDKSSVERTMSVKSSATTPPGEVMAAAPSAVPWPLVDQHLPPLGQRPEGHSLHPVGPDPPHVSCPLPYPLVQLIAAVLAGDLDPHHQLVP